MPLMSRAVLLVACAGCNMAIVPVYDEKQVVMMPELAGIWRDSADGLDYIVQAFDSSYSIRLVEGRPASASEFTAHLARDDSGSMLLNLTPEDDYVIDAIDGRREIYGAHFGRMNSYFVVTSVSRDSIRLASPEPDSLSSYVKRSHGSLAAMRMLMVPEPRELQGILRSYQRAGGQMVSNVFRRVPVTATCLSDFTEEFKVHGRAVSNDGFVRRHGLGMKLLGDSAVVAGIGGQLPHESFMSRAAFVFYDTAGATEIAHVSRTQPLATYFDDRNHYRLELRWEGVHADSATVVVSSCPDFIPSSTEAARADPPRFDSEQSRWIPADQRVGRIVQRFIWTRVPGATHYEFMECGYRPDSDCRLRWTVPDTTFEYDGRHGVMYSVRVRAFTGGIGFGRQSAIFTTRPPVR